MELVETVQLMLSNDYKDRFKGEYLQTKIRHNKLKTMCDKWDNDELDFKPTCPREIYNEQLSYMFSYLCVLEERAQLEGVDLNDVSKI